MFALPGQKARSAARSQLTKQRAAAVDATRITRVRSAVSLLLRCLRSAFRRFSKRQLSFWLGRGRPQGRQLWQPFAASQRSGRLPCSESHCTASSRAVLGKRQARELSLQSCMLLAFLCCDKKFSLNLAEASHPAEGGRLELQRADWLAVAQLVLPSAEVGRTLS